MTGRGVAGQGTDMDSQPYQPLLHIPASAGRTVVMGTSQVTFKLVSTETAGTLTVAEATTAPGIGSPTLHTHPESETFYIIAGEWEVRTVTADGHHRFRAGPGALLYTPPGTPHQFVNVGATSAKALVVMQPGGLERLYAELGSTLGPDGTLDLAKLVALQARYGIQQVQIDQTS